MNQYDPLPSQSSDLTRGWYRVWLDNRIWDRLHQPYNFLKEIGTKLGLIRIFLGTIIIPHLIIKISRFFKHQVLFLLFLHFFCNSFLLPIIACNWCMTRKFILFVNLKLEDKNSLTCAQYNYSDCTLNNHPWMCFYFIANKVVQDDKLETIEAKNAPQPVSGLCSRFLWGAGVLGPYRSSPGALLPAYLLQG